MAAISLVESHKSTRVICGEVMMMKWRLDDGQIEVVDDRVAEALRSKTHAERVAMVLDADRTMRLLIAGHLRTYHPDWDDKLTSAEIARRMSSGTG